MRVAAAGLARFLDRETALPPRPPTGLRRRSFPHQFKGDLDAHAGRRNRRSDLRPTSASSSTRSSVWAICRTTPTGRADSDVLLLGDSYSLIFASVDGGKGASFAEHLAFALDRPVRRSAKVAANGSQPAACTGCAAIRRYSRRRGS